MTKRLVIGSACCIAGEPVAIGAVLELDDATADQLVSLGRATFAPAPPAEEEPPAPPAPPAPSRRASKPVPKTPPKED
jgi:hypothetical protein